MERERRERGGNEYENVTTRERKKRQ